MLFHSYIKKLQVVQMHYMSAIETGAFSRSLAGILAAKCVSLEILSFFGDALSRIFKIFENEYPNRQ